VTTIVLAEDHRVVRQGLAALIGREPDLTVLGETGDGLEAPALVERLGPDVLLLDLMLPGLAGLEVIRRVRERRPATRVVVLSMHGAEAYVLAALRAGATAYVVKDAPASELLRAIREAAAGRRYLSPPLSEAAIEAYVERVGAATADPYEALTPREREVLSLVAEGFTSREVGRRLGISPRTVETHRGNLLRKLGLGGPGDVARFALARGLLPPERTPAPRRSRSRR